MNHSKFFLTLIIFHNLKFGKHNTFLIAHTPFKQKIGRKKIPEKKERVRKYKRKDKSRCHKQRMNKETCQRLDNQQVSCVSLTWILHWQLCSDSGFQPAKIPIRQIRLEAMVPRNTDSNAYSYTILVKETCSKLQSSKEFSSCKYKLRQGSQT